MFAGEDFGLGRLVGMTLGRNPDPSADRRLLELIGPQAYWDQVGSQRALALGRFDGATPFSYRGLAAGDMRFTTLSAPLPTAVEYVSLCIQRGIFKGGEYLLLSCSYIRPSSDARAKGLTSSSNPAFVKYCTPFFESLEFKG
jgi:hypothetical protein